MKIKPMIKPEDFSGIHDESHESEEKEKRRRKEVREWFLKERPELANRVMSGNCFLCDGFANIHCVNCDQWICVEHWRKHGEETHYI